MDGKIPVIHTFKSDISEYVKTKDISLVDIAAEATKQRRLTEAVTEKPKRGLIIAAFSLLLMAGLVLGGWIFLKNKRMPTEGTPETPKPLIVSEDTKIIVLNSEKKANLVSLARESLGATIPLNTVRYLSILSKTELGEEYLDAKKFLKILGAEPPPNFIQSLDGAFTLGVFYLKSNTPLLILKIRSFDLAMNGVLTWEKNMARDLKEIMLIKNLPVLYDFRDKTLKNHDVRVLYDESENPVLMHSFMDKERLVITTNFETLEEIFKRLTGL